MRTVFSGPGTKRFAKQTIESRLPVDVIVRDVRPGTVQVFYAADDDDVPPEAIEATSKQWLPVAMQLEVINVVSLLGERERRERMQRDHWRGMLIAFAWMLAIIAWSYWR